jgi:hypothetical protein
MIEGMDDQGNPVSYPTQQSAALEDLTNQLSSLAIESNNTNILKNNSQVNHNG